MRLFVGYIILCLSCCFNSKSQDSIKFTKKFETHQNNIPLNIIRSKDCFFVLRYNKDLHDFTIEKRAEGDGHQIHFTFLKLDDVCSHLFDYENLDYFLLEKENKLFFIFEKITNSQKTIYQKIIDSTGYAGKFTTLCTLEWDKNIQDVNFLMKPTVDNKLLIIASIIYLNGIVKKSAVLFDLINETPVWIKKLPNENFGIRSGCFVTDEHNDLWHICTKFIEIKDTSAGEIYVRDLLLLYHIPADAIEATGVILKVPKDLSPHDAVILPYKNGIIFFSNLYKTVKENNSELINGYFYAEYIVNDTSIYSKLIPYDEATTKKLTFYDGNDYNDPGYKPFSFTDNFIDGRNLIVILERKQYDFFKDILTVKFDMDAGKIKWMHVLPRKIFFFPSRTQYKSIGCYSASYLNNTLNIYFLDHPSNLKKNIATTSYSKSEKLMILNDGVISKIKIADNGISKSLFFSRPDYRLISLKNNPVKKESRLMFYFNYGSWEKFGVE